MKLIPDFIDKRNGKKPITYLHPMMENTLKETYGIIVYQEQVQLIAARIASYSLGEADLLRRAMGKKIASEMAQQRGRFLEGAKANGFDTKKSEELFDLMAKFAEYGFNKSHAAAYCVVAAHTAWLKDFSFATSYNLAPWWLLKAEVHLLNGTKGVGAKGNGDAAAWRSDWTYFALKTTVTF